MAEQTAAPIANEPTVAVRYSLAGDLYYVDRWDHYRPTVWLTVPECERQEVLPFAFWSVRSGDAHTLPESAPLVTRYRQASGWPDRGSAQWLSDLNSELASRREQAAWAADELARHEHAVAALERSRARFGDAGGAAPTTTGETTDDR